MERKPLLFITEPGDYRTRDGHRVTIHSIYNGPIPYTFPCKGSVWRMFRGKPRPRGLQVWCETGHINSLGESPLDIVAPWDDNGSEKWNIDDD